jgi:diguanylate cyclase (GGDEF)-like protein
LHELAARAASGPIVEQDLAAAGANGLRIVSCYALGLGANGLLGALIVGHTDLQPRGFTQLCRRVGRALADATELSLLAAMAREEIAEQRDRYALEARTDHLTGLASRVQWEEALTTEEARWQRYGHSVVLVSMDLNGLKEANDRYGHAVGDELLRGAAQIVRSSLRASDVVARIGGDEFGALLRETDAVGAAALRARIQSAIQSWHGTQPGARLSLSVGWAVAEAGESLRETFARADRDMYRAKRALVTGQA